MPNLLANAAFLDGATGWTGGTNCTLAVDEDTLGGPGRTVLTCSTASNGSPLEVVSDAIALTAGDALFVQARARATADRAIAVSLKTSGGSVVQVIPMVRAPTEAQSAGIREGLALFTGQAVVASTGNHVLSLRSNVSMSGSRVMTLARPMVAVARADGLPIPFDPGVATAEDLDLPIWPSALRPFRNPVQITPVPNRVGFQTATGHNKTRLLYREPPADMKAQVRCLPGEVETLEAFYAEGHDRFWVVRPDTDRLCVATWLVDGAPRPVEFRGPTTIMEVGLQVVTA